MKTYNDLIQFPTLLERFEYLKIHSKIGARTFGGNRWLNQTFYQSEEWKKLRRKVILRDKGCDLGVPGEVIQGAIYIHHLEPITYEDIRDRNLDKLLNENNLICCSFNTHQAIHYSDSSLLPKPYEPRTQGDTQLWTPIKKA